MTYLPDTNACKESDGLLSLPVVSSGLCRATFLAPGSLIAEMQRRDRSCRH
jgi:hypothetical protein